MSAEMQQDKRFALRCGWTDDLIIMDTRDLGLSGRLRMEDRPAFSDMIMRIAEGKIKAIIAANVSRLFRDRWGKEYSRFMEICYTYGVKVIIANKTRTGIEYIYDFSNSDDVNQFRRKCEEAWSYIENQIYMMQAFKNEVGYSGRWAGWYLPTGYTVDLREKINGNENPNYKKYVPYAPWAEKVARLQARFREIGGSVYALFRELERTEFLFPPFEDSVPKELRKKTALTEVYENPNVPEDQRIIKGYKFTSIYGLTYMLKNPANIGHFLFKGVISYDNHLPIVDYMDFIYAFNRLSSTNLDGTPNVDYLERAGTYVKRHISEKPAYLRNHIKAADEKNYCSYTEEVQMKTKGTIPFYSFYIRNGGGIRQDVYTISAPDVDRVFLARFVERLQMPEAEDEFGDFLSEEQAAQENHTKRLKELQVHIDATESIIEKSKRRLAMLVEDEHEDDELIRELVNDVKKSYREHKLELKRLQVEYERLVTTDTDVEKRRSFKRLMRDAGAAWEEVVTIEDVIELIDLFAKKVTIDWKSPQFLNLTIHWKDDEWGIDNTVCFKGGCPSPHWSDEEKQILREHYAMALGKDLMRLLPLRSLESIKSQAWSMKLRRQSKKKELNVRKFCLRDIELMEVYNIFPDELQWKQGIKLATSWQAVGARNLTNSLR